jgi:hypothetical protein
MSIEKNDQYCDRPAGKWPNSFRSTRHIGKFETTLIGESATRLRPRGEQTGAKPLSSMPTGFCHNLKQLLETADALSTSMDD